MPQPTTRRTQFCACITWPGSADTTTITAYQSRLRQYLFDGVLDYIGLAACQVDLTEEKTSQSYTFTIRLVWLDGSSPLELATRTVGEAYTSVPTTYQSSSSS